MLSLGTTTKSRVPPAQSSEFTEGQLNYEEHVFLKHLKLTFLDSSGWLLDSASQPQTSHFQKNNELEAFTSQGFWMLCSCDRINLFVFS